MKANADKALALARECDKKVRAGLAGISSDLGEITSRKTGAYGLILDAGSDKVRCSWVRNQCGNPDGTFSVANL